MANSAALISNEWKERLCQYITEVFQGNKHKMLQINGMPTIFIFFWNEASSIHIVVDAKRKDRKQQVD